MSYKVYWQYAKYFGGWKIIVGPTFVMSLFIAFKTLNDYWVGNWAVAEDQYDNFQYYCGLYFLFSILCTICVFFRSTICQLLSWHATKKLHQDMIESIFKAPINLYFDVTPTGRIMNRFSKDFSGLE